MLASLIPVLFCIALGWVVARIGWVRDAAIKDLSNLVFLVLTPALLFRTMGNVRIQELDFKPVVLYFAAVAILFVGTLLLRGLSKRAAAQALACVFGNTVMIGVPIVQFVFGNDALIVLFTLVSLHSLILLTSATLIFELAETREARERGEGAPVPLWRTLLQAARKSIIHPVPLPILIGLIFAQTGLKLPDGIDKGLQMIGNALSPMALLLVGISLAYTRIGANLRMATVITLVKNVAMPALVLAIAPLLGVSGLPLAVMFVIAAMPVGANVFYFTQRYGVMQQEVSASIAASTAFALVSLPLVIWIAHHFEA
ncbi:AEC family transporter [Diaphorobacter aerolatus]|uniref:AEC family transporter n=1 Tax=Diaphorobacter aerolatus TaxID=1288495 RepID=A0A7H0GKW2_9BURK|nr:AEC family transporter [Diaphorobacter aerolatus]QNP48928.1 AEC family transporter [Diaphorobacter aerolatus]